MTDIREDLLHLQRQIDHLKNAGGFPDVALMQKRLTRLEERIEKLELASTATLDTLSALVEFGIMHLAERHGAGGDLFDSRADTIALRKTKHRLRRYADDAGLTRKRNDLTSTRQDEGRVRPKRHPDPAPTEPRARTTPAPAHIAALPTLTLQSKEIADVRQPAACGPGSTASA